MVIQDANIISWSNINNSRGTVASGGLVCQRQRDEYHETIRHWKSHFYTHLKRKRRNAFDISGEKDTADAEVWKDYTKKKDAA